MAGGRALVRMPRALRRLRPADVEGTLANLAHWYPWSFSFPIAHFWTAWIVIGALVAHIGD